MHEVNLKTYEWNPQTPLEVVLFLVLFGVAFAALWSFIFLILATLGGWRRLAESYRLEGDFNGSLWGWRSARMRFGVNYGSCLTFGASDQGLMMRVFPLFRIGHPALFFPWSDVRAVAREGWVFKYIDLGFSRAPDVTIRIPYQLGALLLQAGRRDTELLSEGRA